MVVEGGITFKAEVDAGWGLLVVRMMWLVFRVQLVQFFLLHKLLLLTRVGSSLP
jgi:hypothetical protein